MHEKLLARLRLRRRSPHRWLWNPETRRSRPAFGFHRQLAGLGALSLAAYGLIGVHLEHAGGARDVWQFLGLFGGLFAAYFLAVSLTSGRHAQSLSTVGVSLQIIVWAALFRLVLLPAGLPPDTWDRDLAADLRSERIAYRSFLLYDNDVWRYLWDGHVSALGFDPYRHAPAELEALADDEDPQALALFEQELWQDIFDRVSYEGYRTVYPPLAQGLFRLLHAAAPGSVFAWKAVVAAFDLGTCLLLLIMLRRRGRPAAALIYAWNPLVLKELAGSGHLDAVMIFFLVLSIHLLDRGRRAAGLAAYGLAVLTKATPILLAGLYLRRTRPRQWAALAATLAAGALPFLGSLEIMARSLLVFAREWVFNPGPWLLLREVGNGLGLDGRAVAGGVSLAVTLGLVAWTLWRDDGSFRRLVSGSFLVLGGFLVFSAAVMPWYLLWVLPHVALLAGIRTDGQKESRKSWRVARRAPERRGWAKGQAAGLALGAAWMVLTALSLLSYLIYIDQFEHLWWLWVEYLGFFGVLAWGMARGRVH